MIDIADAGVRSAVEQATGHQSPHAPEELAGITALQVRHAGEISALLHCTGLTELSLTACNVTSLAEPAGLERLATLHVLACPIEEASPLAGHPTLTELWIDFGLLEDLEPLTRIANLRQGRFLGNPINEANWNNVRPHWQRSRTADTGRPRLLEFGTTEAWRLTRKTWELGVRLCSGMLDGGMPVVVRPGVPAEPGVLVDAIHGFGVAVLVAARRGDPTDEIYQRNAEWAASQGLAPPTDFASHRKLGDAQDARAWVAGAPDADRELFERLIAHFPDGVFFREDEAVHRAMVDARMPGPVAASRSVLAGLLADDDDTRFRLDSLPGSPHADRADEIWYVPTTGVYATDERRALFRDEAGLFPLAEWIETGHSILATRFDDDPAIYEFGEEDLQVTRRIGRALGESVHRVFASHAALLAHIAAYRYSDGVVFTAVPDLDDDPDPGRR